MSSIEWSHLNEHDLGLVQTALVAAHDGPFFEDWEFETLMGVSRAQVREVIDALASSPRQWPASAPTFFETAAQNALLNLRHYRLGAREVEVLATTWKVDLDGIGEFLDRHEPRRR